MNYDIKRWPWRWERFKQFTYNQIDEILSRYGSVDILWLDGGWVCPQQNQDIDMPRIASMARKHQPGILVVDRTIHGPYENYQTPEQTIPKTQLNYPWESCISLTDDWGWVPRPRWKSATRIISSLTEIVAKGGNLVLGVGPTPEGLIQPEAVARLDSIGAWLKQNGKAIYNTTTTPHYHEGDHLWFTASKDGKTYYAIYTPNDGEPLPPSLSWTTNLPIGKVRLLSTKKPLHTSVKNGTVTVQLPSDLPLQPFAIEFRKRD